MTLAERFWPKVDKRHISKCWEWTGVKSHNGYGQLWMNGKMEGAHRIAVIIDRGWVDPTLVVCHHCDNKSCVNPTHLFVGTQTDNLKDASRKGRIARGKTHWWYLYPSKRCSTRGENNGMAKLASCSVNTIRDLWQKGGVTQSALGARFGVSRHVVGDLLRGKTWKHVAREQENA